MNPWIQFKTTILRRLAALMIGCSVLSPAVQAVSPPPDGGYPGGNTAEGQAALLSLTTGGFNTAIGFLSLRSNSAGALNTATGAGTLLVNTADQNTATGAAALLSNTGGTQNTADGAFALFSNTVGANNTAAGISALKNNTSGSSNTAIGGAALESNTTGVDNTGIGGQALDLNTTGDNNTATGGAALASNTSGSNNTANGFEALASNSVSDLNTAIGYQALASDTGDHNTAVGYQALARNTTGTFNVALAGGFNLTTGNFNIDIGNDGVAGESATIRIGSGCCQSSAFIAGIWGNTVSGGTAVFINSDGQLGTATSSARFKRDIQNMERTSETLFALRPVTFRYKKEIDPAGISRFGLVAEDVEKVSPDLVVRDKQGKPYSVRYDQVNAMLLNEFLKEHRAFLEERNKVDKLEKQIAALTAGLQKVSAELELKKSAPQTVLNNR